MKEVVMGEDAPSGQQELVRCQVTGEMVPADEIVEFQGQMVSAHGKEILIDRLKSGESLPGQVEPPNIWRRFLALVIDALILGVPGFFLYLLFLSNAGGSLSDIFNPPRFQAVQEEMKATQWIQQMLGLAIFFTYWTLFHGLKGQSIGKMALRIKVVNLDMTPIGIRTAFLRALYYNGPQVILPFVLIFTQNEMVTILISIIASPYFIVNVVMALADSNRQRSLHDRLAGTRVIQLE